jgi:predicted nucleic acid-binding protein
MGTEEIAEVLSRHPKIALDSCTLIYALEGHPLFGPPAGRVLSHLREGKSRGIVSMLAAAEVLVAPYARGKDSHGRVTSARLTQLPNVDWVPLNYAIADRAAVLRANAGCGLADAVHLATAVQSGASLFVTNDCGIPAVPGLECLQLSDYVT